MWFLGQTPDCNSVLRRETSHDSSDFSVYRMSPLFLQPTLPLVTQPCSPLSQFPTPEPPYSFLASLQRLPPSPGTNLPDLETALPLLTHLVLAGSWVASTGQGQA